MILDFNFNKKRGQLTFSYITETGGKKLLIYNVSRFKTFYETPNGKFQNWNGKPCDITYTENPGWTEFRTFIEELPESDKKLLFGRYNPRLYTFDIETRFDPSEFPEPSEAKFEITNISIVNDKLDAIVLGVRGITDESKINKLYHEWLNKCQFFKNLGLEMPRFRYFKFDNEHDMLKYFLTTIVAKAAVLAGWNSLGFDWLYIQNRIKNYYPDLSFSSCSIDWTMSGKQIYDLKQSKTRLSIPNHTLILDMMDVIGTFDMVVMPIKENLSLDYIASESPVGMHKIQYDGDLEKLYRDDYDTYVFYNLIDSVLVQLIDKCFKTLNNIYMQALFCRTKINNAFSKIALSEALFFNYFYEHNIKVVPSGRFQGERGELPGAYVRTPTPGKHKFVCCDDFASLYPSTIITTNISIENYLGKVEIDFTVQQIEDFKKDPNYFVSVEGCVFKNDKDYAFKIIQKMLKENRGISKYLSKDLDASVMLDIEHVLKGVNPPVQIYSDRCIEALNELGYNIKSTSDLHIIDNLQELGRLVKLEIIFHSCREQAMKLLANSLYGGSSHIAFEWFSLELAQTITAEARNIIHLMEGHIPQFFEDNWFKMTDLHKKLGIKLKDGYVRKMNSKQLL